LRRVPAILTPHLTARAGCVFLGVSFPHNVNTVNFPWHDFPKVRFFALVSCLLLFPGFVAARGRADVAKIDSDYAGALAAADRFLHAWQTQGSRKRTVDAHRCGKGAFVRTAAAGVFLARGRGGLPDQWREEVESGRYAFPVALLESPAKGQVRRRYSEIIVMRTRTQDWVVDKMP
jgi:hypothetical protein